jgi:hypothetical protein
MEIYSNSQYLSKREQVFSEKEVEKKSSSNSILKDHSKQKVATEQKEKEHEPASATSNGVEEIQKSHTKAIYTV